MKRAYQTSEGLDPQLSVKAEKQLQLGFLNLSEGLFDLAKTNFQLAIEYDKKCADGFWGIMLAKLKVKNEDELYDDAAKFASAQLPEESEKALEYANEAQKNIYQKLLENILKISEGENY